MKNQNTVDIAGIEVSGLKRPREPPDIDKSDSSQRGGTFMTEKAKKREQVEEIAKRFVGLNEEQKSYIVGYMNGVQEERQRWERKQAAVATA